MIDWSFTIGERVQWEPAQWGGIGPPPPNHNCNTGTLIEIGWSPKGFYFVVVACDNGWRDSMKLDYALKHLKKV